MEPALAEIDTEIEEDAVLILLFHHLGDGADAEAFAGGEDAFDDRALAQQIVDVT